jgi:hypothetical protein
MATDRPPPRPPAGSPLWVHEWDGGVVVEFPARRRGLDFARGLWRYGPAVVISGVMLLLVLVGLPDAPLFRFLRLLGFTFAAAGAVAAGGIGLVLLLMNQGAVLHDAEGTRQLRANVDALARIDALGQRHVWDRKEIADVRCETYEEPDGHFHGVFLRPVAGERVLLHGRVAYHEAAGPRRAELDWIAAVLRHALRLDEVPSGQRAE